MIEKQMILEVYNVWRLWKLHRPRISHGLLADCVDMSLASLLYSCTTLYNKCGVQWSARWV